MSGIEFLIEYKSHKRQSSVMNCCKFWMTLLRLARKPDFLCLENKKSEMTADLFFSHQYCGLVSVKWHRITTSWIGKLSGTDATQKKHTGQKAGGTKAQKTNEPWPWDLWSMVELNRWATLWPVKQHAPHFRIGALPVLQTHVIWKCNARIVLNSVWSVSIT